MHFINNLLPTMQHLGVFGYWFVLLISLAESLVVVGSIVPGATVVVLAGFLSAQGYLDIGALIWFAAIGAILGDGISYYLGTKGTKFFKHENKYLKISHLEKGKEFFKKHGNKSIFFARFLGFIRAILPFIAGLSKMDLKIFLFWNITSAFVWSASHLLLGYFFGASLGLIEGWISRVGIFLIILAVLFFLVWLIVKYRKKINEFIKSITLSIGKAITENEKIQQFIKEHPKTIGFINLRISRENFTGLPLTILSIVFLYVLLLFAGTVQNVLNANTIVALDLRLADLFYAFRDPTLVKIFLLITLLGKSQIVISIAVIASTIFFLIKERIYIFTLALTIVGSGIFVFLGKLLVHRLRPGEIIPYYQELSLSFPSGHATAAVAFYGFIIYFLWKHLRTWKAKTLTLFIGVFIIILVGISRMYLGVHYLSDVLGGYLLGLLWLIVAISITEWYLQKKTITKSIQPFLKIKYIIGALILGEIIFFSAYAYSYKPVLNKYQQKAIVENVISPEDIFNSKNSPVKFTEGLLGQKQEPLNFIIIADSDEEIVADFKKSEWYLADPLNTQTLFQSFKTGVLNQPYPSAPMTPSFWNAKVHDLAFEKPTPENTIRKRHHTRIWRTNIETADHKLIYVGTVSLDSGIKWGITHKIDPNIDMERELIFNDLGNSGSLEKSTKIKFVDPTIGQNSAGDDFFTDGELYILTLR